MGKIISSPSACIEADPELISKAMLMPGDPLRAKKLAETGNTLTLGFKMDMKQDDFLMVMCFVDGQWVILDADQVEILEDGTVNVTFTERVGTIAFVVEKTEG